MTRNRPPRGAAETRDHRASGAKSWGMKFWTVSWKRFGNSTPSSDQPKPNMDRFSSSLSAQNPRKRDDGLAKRPPGRGRWRAVSERQESKLFAPLDATVSLRTCPGGQTSSGQDWKGAGIVGRWLGTSSLVRAVDAWTLIAILGRWPAARVVRSSQTFCHDH